MTTETTDDAQRPFTPEQEAHILDIAQTRFRGTNTQVGYALSYIARFGVAPTSQHLVNHWQAHGSTAGDIHAQFPGALLEAIELLRRIGVEHQGLGELRTGVTPQQLEHSHIVPTFVAVREVLEALPDESADSTTDESAE